MSRLLDDDGENLAVRSFLVLYGTPGLTVRKMRDHMRNYGFPLWPEWAGKMSDAYLTKSGAQDWLRHLFALEATPLQSDAQGGKACRKRLCRDCADLAQDGICPNDGRPCSTSGAAPGAKP